MGEQKDPEDECGLTTDQRLKKSRASEVCGMRNCAVPPEQVCKTCNFWYCSREFPFHMQKYPDHARETV